MKVRFLSIARREMMREARRYDKQGSQLGDAFLDEVAHSLFQIKEFPHAAPPIGGIYRRHIMNRFPFSLVYRIDGDIIVIAALAHHSRRPHYWRSRIKN